MASSDSEASSNATTTAAAAATAVPPSAAAPEHRRLGPTASYATMGGGGGFVAAAVEGGATRKKLSASRRKGSEWEILGSLEKGVPYQIQPKKYEGFLSKKRKWPLKGWHKRYFVLEKGVLTYGKSAQDISRGRTHGRIDIGPAVISLKTEMLRIDIDDEECIHHIKVHNSEDFALWVEQLKQHRLYQQHLINSSSTSPLSPPDDGVGVGGPPAPTGAFISPRNSLTRNMRAPGARFPGGGGGGGGGGPGAGPSATWLQEFTAMDDNMTRQLLNIQQQALSLALLAQKIEDEQNAALGNAGTKTKKLFGLRKKKSTSVTKTTSDPHGSRTSTLASVTSGASVSTAERSPTSSAETGANDIGGDTVSASGSSSSTLVNMASLSNSNPSLAGSLNSGMAGGRPVSLPAEAVNATGRHAKVSSVSSHQLSSTVAPATSHASSCSGGSGAMGPPPALSTPQQPAAATSTATAAVLAVSDQTQEMLTLAQDIQTDVSGLMRNFCADRDRLKSALDTMDYMVMNMSKTGTLGGGGGGGGNVAVVAALRQSLNQAMQQNSMLRARLQKIHLDSDVGDLPMVSTANVDTLSRGMNHSLSYSSSCISEFFDAREYSSDHAPSDEYNDSSDDDENTEECEEDVSTSDDDQLYMDTAQSPPPTSHISNAANLAAAAATVTGGVASSGAGTSATATPAEDQPAFHDAPVPSVVGGGGGGGGGSAPDSMTTGRRQLLPVPKADTEGINLWNLLCKNIGKDLSKISMPVTLNEPLSALQRLCEELEYSELLDKAASADSPLERMMWVAAFAVSVYGSGQARAGHKPFNPLLGETFECVREDRGFRYVAEQVSHHPPISACHADSFSGKWTWSQDLRVKTKFWGKSMEFQPVGLVRVELRLGNNTTETYEWNKITTCIHNLFGGSDRWVDLYGQCVIKSRAMTCKLDFVKCSYWSNKKHEVFGSITDKNGKVLQHLFGKWSEALYCGQAPSAKCIWRPAMLPADSHLYYGFSRFAIELNELMESERDLMPITDTRFRPDQRLLEEGHITEAENMKLKLEQKQRERRHAMEERGETHDPRWFRRATPTSGGSGSSGRAGGGAGAEAAPGAWEFGDEYWQTRTDPGFKECDLDKLW